MDKELAALELAAATIEDNLRDKEAALALDERCVLLDGRINLATPPPSSVASVPLSQVSACAHVRFRPRFRGSGCWGVGVRADLGLEEGRHASTAAAGRPACCTMVHAFSRACSALLLPAPCLEESGP